MFDKQLSDTIQLNEWKLMLRDMDADDRLFALVMMTGKFVTAMVRKESKVRVMGLAEKRGVDLAVGAAETMFVMDSKEPMKPFDIAEVMKKMEAAASCIEMTSAVEENVVKILERAFGTMEEFVDYHLRMDGAEDEEVLREMALMKIDSILGQVRGFAIGMMATEWFAQRKVVK